MATFSRIGVSRLPAISSLRWVLKRREACLSILRVVVLFCVARRLAALIDVDYSTAISLHADRTILALWNLAADVFEPLAYGGIIFWILGRVLKPRDTHGD